MSMIRINRNPDPAMLRWFTLLWFPAAMLIIGFLLYGRTANFFPAAIFWALAIGVPPIGLVFPRLMRNIYVGWMTAMYPVEMVTSFLIVSVVWLFVVTPVGLVLRLTGFDGMQRRRDPKAASYWEEYSPHGKRDRYFRQF